MAEQECFFAIRRIPYRFLCRKERLIFAVLDTVFILIIMEVSTLGH